MRDFLEQITACIDAAIFAPALASAMIVPDSCGAIEYPGEKNGQRYRRWYDTYCPTFHSQRITFSGEAVWAIRNGMMHETRLVLTRFGFDRVLFTVPNRANITMHMCSSSIGGESALNVDLVEFCRGVIKGCERWLDDIATDAVKQERLGGLIQYRSQGLAPHIVGLPLVC